MNQPTRNEIETAHQARNRAAVDSWTFAQFARGEAARLRTKRSREVAAKALRAARLTATVCL
jgi:hypothetical protein